MCTKSVADSVKAGKARTPGGDAGRLEGWAPYGGRKGADGRRNEAPQPPGPYESEAAFGRLSASILDEAGLIVPGIRPWVDRRAADRVVDRKTGASAVILSDREREIARHQLATAATCGSGTVALRGFGQREGRNVERRLVLRTHCGTRRCQRCDATIREHQASRSEGDWRLFITLTNPRSRPAAVAWRGTPAALRRWHRELRRELAVSRRREPEKHERRAAERLARIRIARRRIRGEGKLQYAWCLEAHRDGYPHVHECLSLEWLCYRWAKLLWGEVSGMPGSRIDGRRVWSVEGVCRYLAKYVAKAHLEPAVAAILYGRRAWASTVRRKPKVDDGWFLESTEENTDISKHINAREEWGVVDGWRLESGADERYALWWRPQIEVGVRVVAGDVDAWTMPLAGKEWIETVALFGEPRWGERLLEPVRELDEGWHAICLWALLDGGGGVICSPAGEPIKRWRREVEFRCLLRRLSNCVGHRVKSSLRYFETSRYL